jgi:hypothetical protein
MSQVDAVAESMGGKLSGEITAARGSLNKQRIREAHFKFGEFLHGRGDLSGAVKQFTLARDFASNASEVNIDYNPHFIVFFCGLTSCPVCLLLFPKKKMVEAAIKVIVAAMDSNNLSQVESQCHKVEQITVDNSVLVAQVSAAKGLLLLKRGEFHQAARKFSQVNHHTKTLYAV